MHTVSGRARCGTETRSYAPPLQPTQRATFRVGRQAHPREWHADCRPNAADRSAAPRAPRTRDRPGDMTRPMHSPRLLSSDPTRPAGSWSAGPLPGPAPARPAPGAITTGPAEVPAPVSGDPSTRGRPVAPAAAVDAAAGDPVPHRHRPEPGPP